MNTDKLSRRNFIRNTSITAAATIAGAISTSGCATSETAKSCTAKAEPAPFELRCMIKNGRINQSVSRWCFKKLSLDQLCQVASTLGLKAIDLLKID